MAEDKKTQIGMPTGRTHRPTGSQQPQPAAAAGTPVPASASASPPKTSYIPETRDPLLGATVAGRYLIAKKLGEGGMGSVYLATHTILEKQVALKVLHGEFARKPDLVERFMQEAKAASRIRHQNVIDISDFGSTPEGIVFFAMELLKGQDLHTIVARAKLAGELLPWQRTKKIYLQICGALSAAHAKGIVHRDLKPENVYLVEYLDDPDFVKLLDFGIAKLTEVNEEGRKLTRTGMLFGTPEYMSPEQARGEHVDHRVDVYAMGCILFQLVTTATPFTADNFMGVLSLHLTEQPPIIAPEVFDMIGAPRELAQVIDRALAKDKAERYQTIEELANAVRVVCGDPLPSDKSQPNRLPSVPAPATTTTRARSPSAVTPVNQRAIVTPVGREPTGPVKTVWTGNLKVPEQEVAPAAKQKSKVPLIVGALVLAGGAAAAAIVVLGGGGGQGQGAGSGSALAVGSAVVPNTGAAPIPAPVPAPVKDEPLPDMVKLSFDSSPKGATVIDLTTNKPIGKTPTTYTVPGSKTARQFKLSLRGYGDSTVELVPNKPVIEFKETLVKGATATVKHVTDPILKTVNAGSAVTEPVTKPDTGSAAKPPDDVKPPDVKPPDVKPPPPKDDCPDDDSLPCLKRMPTAGSGS